MRIKIDTLRTHGPSKAKVSDTLQEVRETAPPTMVDRTAKPAEVSASVSKKVSHKVDYGKGSFDNVFYSVEVTAHVSLPSGSSKDEVASTFGVAWEAANTFSSDGLNAALEQHLHEIVTVHYKELFDE